MNAYAPYRDVKQLQALLAHLQQFESGKLVSGDDPRLLIRREQKHVFGAALMRASIELPRAANVDAVREAVARLALAVAHSLHHGPSVAFALADFLLAEGGCTLPLEEIDTAREAFSNAIHSARVTDLVQALSSWKR
jgi:hypothetical protein